MLYKTTPATNFCSLPIIAECSIKFILQFIFLTFTVIFSLFHKNQKWNGCYTYY